MAEVDCLYCTGRHEPRWLCDSAKRVLDGLLARGMAMDMPTLEFPDPIPMSQQPGLGQVDDLIAQLVVMGATVDTAGLYRPALVFTGRTVHGGNMPRLLYPGSNQDLRRTVALVRDMAETAIRNAAKANRAENRGG